MIKKSRVAQRERIKRRIQKKIRGTADRPRLVVYRSLQHVYAQLVDDTNHRTLAAASSLSPELRDEVKSMKGMKDVAKLVGKQVGLKAIEKNLKNVVFDRNGYMYHGIVKSLADGARESGLEF